MAIGGLIWSGERKDAARQRLILLVPVHFYYLSSYGLDFQLPLP
jgi:hypothetical protein